MVHLWRQVRRDHVEVERLAWVAHGLLDGADGVVRVRRIGRQPDHLLAQLDRLLVPVSPKVTALIQVDQPTVDSRESDDLCLRQELPF